MLTVVDVASGYREAEPLTSKNSDEVAQAFQKIYKGSPMKWQGMWRLTLGANSWALLQKKWKTTKTYIRRGRAEIHRDQAIVEHFNRSLAKRLFEY